MILLKSSLDTININNIVQLNTTNLSENYSSFDFQNDLKKNFLNNLNRKNFSTMCHVQPNGFKFGLLKYVYPILIVFGILGNSLSFLALIKINRMTKKSNRKFTVCLAILCFCDLILVIFSCLREHLEGVFHFSIRSYSTFTCKTFFFICYLFSSFASYLYAYIAFERWYAISNPLKYKHTKEKNIITRICLLFLFCVSISVPFLLFTTIHSIVTPFEINKNTCDILEQYYLYLTILDALMYCAVPFLITFIFSGLTLVKLIKKSRFKSKNKSASGSESNVSNSTLASQVGANRLNIIDTYKLKKQKLFSIKFSKKSHQKSKPESNAQSSAINSYKLVAMKEKPNVIQPLCPQFNEELISRSKPSHSIKKEIIKQVRIKRSSDVKTTIMLMTLPISYLAVTFPVFVIIALQFINNFFLQENEPMHDYDTEFAFSKTVMYLNNSFNIQFLMLFGKSLRKDLQKILGFRTKKQVRVG